MATDSGAEDRERDPHRAPSITLPKGGGALRAIDETFSVNSANGTCDLSLNLPFSRTRSGLDGAVALRYSSGSGNSPFGLGWSISLSAIQRRTDRHLPRYEDDDVFILNGGEDLVPAFKEPSPGNWVEDVANDGTAHARRYRPRLESAFARIENIAIDGEAGSFWKVTTRDNVVTIYGRTSAARIADPADGSRVFRWLPEWAYDDKGNCVAYLYKPEDLQNVPDVVEEKARLAAGGPLPNRYLKSIRYGNRVPYFPGSALQPSPPSGPEYMFEVLFDYGEHDDAAPSPAEARTWPCRWDAFSDCRAGFEIRTWRLCRRVLFFHYFTELNAGQGPAPEACLVRSIDLQYRHFAFDGSPYQRQEADLVVSVTRRHYKRAGGGYESRAFPPLDFTYHELQWSTAVQSVSPGDVAGAPAGNAGPYQFIDLDGDGAPGILTEQAGAWYYKSNRGDGRFSAIESITPKPSFAGVASGRLQFEDLDADGSRQLVSRSDEPRGYFARDDDDVWEPFRAFDRMPSIDFADPNLRFIDLDGDGKSDLLISEENVFRWYPSVGTRGYGAPLLADKPSIDEERGPAVVFADGTQTIFIADMNGDGLAEIVRIRNGEVSYWPNHGYGRFGPRVIMADSPLFDTPDGFDPSRVQLADVSGTGAADLIYLGGAKFTAWINLAGNGWSAAQTIDPFPGTEAPNRVSVIDLLGNGTASLVWSSPLPANARAPLRYIDLMGGRKPYLLSAYSNNLGKTTTIFYKSSTHYALLDRSEGRPWATKLPFPSACVSRSETRDSVSGSLYVREYRYRHGYYDHAEREFRGFGMVEETDSETFDRFQRSGATNVVDVSLHQPPKRTRTWYHTGAYVRGEKILSFFAADYFVNPIAAEHALPDAVIDSESPLTPEELRQAARACKGMVLRQEIYADDGTSLAPMPYNTAAHNCAIRVLQPSIGGHYAVFVVNESEAITYHYERDPSSPRVGHTLNVAFDEIGNVVESASVVYARTPPDLTLPAEVRDAQAKMRATYVTRLYTNDVETGAHRMRQLCETKTWELSGPGPASGAFTPHEIGTRFAAATILQFEDDAHDGVSERRLIRHERTLFAADANPSNALPLQSLQPLGLLFATYRLVLTPSLRTALYGTRVTDAMLVEGKYTRGDDLKASGHFPAGDHAALWWSATATVFYPLNPETHFYLPDRFVDPLGSTTTVHYYSDSHLLIEHVDDALGNRTSVLEFDFRHLLPRSTKDINDNIVDVRFDIRGLVAGVAERGKGSEGEDFTGFTDDLSQAQIDAFLGDPAANGALLLRNATRRFIYSFAALPVVAASITRETSHAEEAATGTPSKLQYAFEYSDGLGRVAMKKAQAEPGLAKSVVVHGDGTITVAEVDTSPALRWIGSGRKIVNNKGNRVMEYEPYFSVTHRYETAKELVESGVTPLFFYDPLDRLVRTEFPDGTLARVEFDTWKKRAFDQNDTVSASDWHAARIGGGLGVDEQHAAQNSEVHDDTPQVEHFDSLGRTMYAIEHNKFIDRVTHLVTEQFYPALIELDVEGNRRRIRDARNVDVMRWSYDMLARPSHSISPDAGQRFLLNDVMDHTLYRWDQKDNRFHSIYDALHRPTETEVSTPAPSSIVYEKIVYGTDKTKNLNGKVSKHHDGSGIVENVRYDFRDGLLETKRTFTDDFSHDVDWTNPALVTMQPHTYTTTSDFDALRRIRSRTTPDGSVTAYRYSASNLLTATDVAIRGAASSPFVTRIDHDAKGQRTKIVLGNGTETGYTYDPKTFRVRRILTTRTSDGATLQDLSYTYDPSANVTHIHDAAQQTLYFNNRIVEPDNDFTYDALYRLVAATGRELIGLNAAVSRFDSTRINVAHKADGDKMQMYLQQYEYDEAGNLRFMVHDAGMGPFAHQWTRELVPKANSNRLDTSTVGAATDHYTFDDHGNMTSAGSIASMTFNVLDQFRSIDLGGGGTAFYTYTASGDRTRKVIVRPGAIVEERLYLGGVEVFTSTTGGAVDLQRETLHVMDDARRIAIVDTRVDTPSQLIRFQYSNHLDTASLELDDHAAVISYEEYYPFGSTSLQSVDTARDVPARRYRYIAKERDEESGLYYCGARYYAPWIGRWISPDPKSIEDGLNVYAYVRGNPIRLHDPTGMQGDEPTVIPVNTDRSLGDLHRRVLQIPPVRLPPRAPHPLQFRVTLPPPPAVGSSIRIPSVLVWRPERPAFPPFIVPRASPPDETPEPPNIDPGADLPNATAAAGPGTAGVVTWEHRFDVSTERWSTQDMIRYNFEHGTISALAGYAGMMGRHDPQGGFLGGAQLRIGGRALGTSERGLDLGEIWTVGIDTTADNPVSIGITGAASIHIAEGIGIDVNAGVLGTAATERRNGAMGVLASTAFTSGPWSIEYVFNASFPREGATTRHTVDMNFRLFNAEGTRRAGSIYVSPYVAVQNEPNMPTAGIVGLGVTTVFGAQTRPAQPPH